MPAYIASTYLKQAAANLVNRTGDHPGNRNLEHDRKGRPLPAVRFGVDRGYRGGTGNIEQREEHHAVGIELSKAALAHHRGQSRQGCRRIDVDAIEEDGETGSEDFL